MKKVLALVCVLTMTLSMTPLFAEEGEGEHWIVSGAASDNYAIKAPAQLVRGIHNVAFGWAEIIRQPVRHTKNDPLLVGTVTGIVVGPFHAVLRTLSGAVDIVSFWFPGFNGFPMEKAVLGGKG